MNLDINVTVNGGKIARTRSWMAVDYRYPSVLVYDIETKRFHDQIAYNPGPFAITANNKINGTHNIPQEFRLEFHLKLEPTHNQPSD